MVFWPRNAPLSIKTLLCTSIQMFLMLQTGLEEINLNGSADGTADDSNCMGVVAGGLSVV